MLSEHLGIGANVFFYLLTDSGVAIDLYMILNTLEQGSEILLVF